LFNRLIVQLFVFAGQAFRLADSRNLQVAFCGGRIHRTFMVRVGVGLPAGLSAVASANPLRTGELWICWVTAKVEASATFTRIAGS